MKLLLFFFATVLSSMLYAQTNLINYGESWKYLDNGSNQGTAWRSVSFNDASWASGNAQLGYGDGDEATVVSYGPNANNKYITTYFRKTITVGNAAVFTGFTLNVKRDDGAVVYINGTQRFRTNMPSGNINYTTKASSDAADDGNTPQTISLPAGILVNGTNVIAVEVHQRTATSTDISFDLQLLGNGDVTPPSVTSLTPADNAINIPGTSNLTLTFNETVQKGTGNILIKEGGIITQTIDVASATVIVTGNTVTIDPADFGNGAAVNIEIAAGVFKDLANNNYAGIADATTWNFNVLFSDIIPPSVTAYSPADDATNVSAGTNLVLTFNEAVQKGTGSILVKEGGVITQTIDVASASVTVTGNTITIDPANFTNSAAVNIEMAAGVFKDLGNNNYAGIADPTVWNFTIIDADITPPVVSDYSPADDATNVSAGTNLVLTFNEAVQKGTGSILVKEGGVITQTIDVTSATVTVAGNTVTIDPADFGNGAAVNIEIIAGAFTDLANNSYTGITDAITWNFNIAADLTPPAVTTYSPPDNATNVTVSSNLVLTFSEAVQKGTGNILIKEAGVTVQTIDVASASVTVAGNVVTINPSDFGYTAAVNIEIAAGAFKDMVNNDYAGITDAITWNFSTEDLVTGPQTFIAYGASWKYLDNGTNQGTAWRAASFNDAAWVSGNAQLGYGDGDEATVVSYGPNASSKYITTYFRKTISVTNPGAFSTIAGSVKRDDGVAIYVNGTEVYRNNLAAGATYTTLGTLASDDGATPQNFSFSPSVFVSGDNVIAVEIHQNAANSSDISFDLQLIGNVPGAALLTRGPYLNMGNETGVTVRWRTDVATNSRIELGTTFGTYPIIVNDAASTTEHIIQVTGLSADTKYFYRIGSSSQVLQSAADNYLITAPPVTANKKIRIAVFGDCGRNDNSFQTQTLNAYLSYTGSNPAEIMLLLGDNAYNNGTDAEYTSGFFTPYQSTILKNHVLYPAPGNHDYYSTSQASRTGAYYQNFTMPTAAECGGIASGTEAFYSFDRGDIHFLSLDSYGTESPNTTRLYDTLGPQVTWIKQDLAANTKKWTVAYWHHPPFTMGSHNSDTETELINIRTNFIRILERYGVDLILCGHSHDYERSYLLKDYFGTEASFNPATHAVSTSSAKYNGTANSCPYITVSGQVNHGTVYVVSGSSGADGGVQAGYPHNAMPWSVDDGGMLYLEVEGNRLDAKFIRRDAVIADQFSIMKDVNKTTDLIVPAGTPTQLSASWIGNYSWSTGETTKTITVSPTSNTTYTVTDGATCLTDIFNMTMAGGNRNNNIDYTTDIAETVNLKINPTVVQRGQSILVQTGAVLPAEVLLVDVNGRIVRAYKFSFMVSIPTADLQKGVYFIKLNGSKNPSQTQKFVVVE